MKTSTESSGMTFEALFYKQLQHVTAQIHETENIEQIMLDASAEICKLFNADRLTLYVVNDDQTAIVSKVKTGLNSSRDLKLPITPQSIAGYVAYSRDSVNLADVYDDDALKKIHPQLTFLKEVDKRSGYRTRQMMVSPILDGDTLFGVLQVINNKNNETFGGLEIEGMSQLCKTLATAIRHRIHGAEDGVYRMSTKYDGLVAEGVMTAAELQKCLQDAREQGQSVEHVLRTQYQVRSGQIGSSLAKFFGVTYEPWAEGRIRAEALHGALKREFIEEQGWVPLEDSPEGLIVMCLDPEAVRSSRIVTQVFPRLTKFVYRVTTHAEFQDTLNQIFGLENAGGSIDEMLADMDSAPMEDGSVDDSLESAAADNELVKFVNKVILDAYHQGVSDIHIEPMPGKLKTGIRFRVDGSLQPYIEVPSHFRQAMVTRLKIMCDLDISERRKPQDGKIKFKKYGPADIELRVATQEDAQTTLDEINWVLSNNGDETIPGLREELQQCMTDNAGAFRTKDTLDIAIAKVKELRERFKNIRIKDKSKVFNTELQEAIEFGHMIDYSAFIVESAVARNESRGAHFREDFDTRDDENFLKHTMAYMSENGDITLDYMDVVLGKHELKARTY